MSEQENFYRWAGALLQKTACPYDPIEESPIPLDQMELAGIWEEEVVLVVKPGACQCCGGMVALPCTYWHGAEAFKEHLCWNCLPIRERARPTQGI